MTIGTLNVVSLVTAAVLFALTLPLFAVSIRRRDAGLLAVFLGLVGVNFLVGGLNCWVWPCPAEDVVLRIAKWTLAWDPFFLLAFVIAHVGGRLTRARGMLLGGVGLASATAAGLAWLHPWGTSDLAVPGTTANPLQVLLIANLVVSYLASWSIALGAHQRAGTPLLRHRARWIAIAVGIAVLPRMALVPWDLGLKRVIRDGALGEAFIAAGLPPNSLSGLLTLSLGGLVLLPTYYAMRRAWPDAGGDRWGPVRIVGLATAALFGLSWLATLTPLLIPRDLRLVTIGGTVAYGLRWVAFSAIVTKGVFAGHPRATGPAADTYVRVMGGVVGGLFVFLGAIVVGTKAALSTHETITTASALGIAATVPFAAVTRRAIKALETVVPKDPVLGRRLGLYRAAVEQAWANGPPGDKARRRLDHDRRTWQVSAAEAHAIEHMVEAMLAPEPATLAVGQELAPGFVIEHELGSGADAQVFLLRATSGGRTLVAKVFRERGSCASAQRFLHEIEALQRIDHPHVVRLLEVGFYGGRRVLFMEHTRGTTLEVGLEAGPLTADAALVVARGLASGLAAVHDAGLVHGDLKPANIWIEDDGRARILDFGLASKGQRRDDLRTTIRGLDELPGFVGTIGYMSPEQALGRRATAASDVYSAGLVLYECLTGRHALDVDARSPIDALQGMARPRIDLEDVAPEWAALLADMLQPDPSRRIQDGGELMRALVEHAPRVVADPNLVVTPSGVDGGRRP